MPDQPPGSPPLPRECAVYEKDVGTWDATVKVFGAPGQVVNEAKGVSNNHLIAAGRWLVMDFRTDTGFEGHGIYGFDPVRGKYVGTWVDTMRPVLAQLEGTWDAEKRTMTFVGEMKTPDGRTMRWREVTEQVDPRTQVFRTYVPTPDGKEHVAVEATYRRR
ncbi:MAG TPA: DUF1579 domain-containing protein [Polyangiaceae bacterium]